eukprot:gnl/TRDRNA2_/TRDRNA2_160674_c1_seq2.p1 gnl/TRDRNA2_/TRDRNA2_160674_c1~~gnl/TRDRNA2_/TRDRNA2_160674_c1_seq2.p1  ORF type:complete len:209 (+),score=8.41 gnl/TRDRNA2_/TRDRNA2_160674_c1_seq2:145-771(+)
MSLAAWSNSSRLPKCPICFERRVLWLRGPCGHGACRDCMKEHLRATASELKQRMRQARRFTAACFMPGCGALLDAQLLTTFVPDMKQLIKNISRRERLISRNPNGWADCPNMDCVGVGYRGERQIMCFMCEEQWNDPSFGPLRRFGERLRNLFPWHRNSCARPCPHCGVQIVKNGGCPNMRCALCRQVFYWGPSHNDIKRANPAFAPP